MTASQATPDPERGVYGISVAAELVGMGPQTLRLYENRGLLEPARSNGGTRRYSSQDLERLRRIAELGSTGLRLAHGRGDEVRTGGGVDPRGKLATALGVDAKEDYNPDLLINRARGGIAVRPRNFR